MTRVGWEKRERVALHAEPFAREAADAPRQVARRFSSRNATSDEMISAKGSDAASPRRSQSRFAEKRDASADVTRARARLIPSAYLSAEERSLPMQLSSHASESERRYSLSRAASKDTRTAALRSRTCVTRVSTARHAPRILCSLPAEFRTFHASRRPDTIDREKYVRTGRALPVSIAESRCGNRFATKTNGAALLSKFLLRRDSFSLPLFLAQANAIRSRLVAILSYVIFFIIMDCTEIVRGLLF